MKMKLYAVEGSSYNGCEGWSSWICDNSITTDFNEAQKYIKEHSSKYIRHNIVVLKEMDIK